MKTSLPVALAAFLALAVAVAGPAAASSKPTRTAASGGYDVSYPQCGSTLPTGQAFGIVGVTGGTAAKSNPCLATELSWAATSSATVDPVQLYVNTADPGQVISQVADWPATSDPTVDPYGSCDGTDTPACSWQYGYDRAHDDVARLKAAQPSANPGAYVWWLDVETSNTWETGSDAALANNRAAVEGMVYYFTRVAGGRSGVYSTTYQWGQIAGTVPAGSPLEGLNSWVAGAQTSRGATSNCSSTPLVRGGAVVLAQYVSSGLDHDLACA